MHVSVIITAAGNFEFLDTIVPLFSAMNRVEVLVGLLGNNLNRLEHVQTQEHNFRIHDLSAAGKQSHSTARNELAALATAPVLFFFDVNFLVTLDVSEWLLANPIGSRFFVMDEAQISPSHLLICRAHDFASVGGYDVNLVGTGREANDILEQLEDLGRERAEISHDLAHARIDRRDIAFSLSPSRRALVEFYCIIKRDLRRLGRSAVGKDFLKSLMQDITKLGELAEARNQDDFSVTISPPPYSLGVGSYGIGKVIEYRFKSNFMFPETAD